MDLQVSRSKPFSSQILFQKPFAHYRHTIAPIKIKEPHNHGLPRPMTR